MRREDLYKEIKLPNLNQNSVSAIAKSMLGGNLQQELAEKLTKESQGNPLYIVETLRMLHEQDSLTQENDSMAFIRKRIRDTRQNQGHNPAKTKHARA